MKKKILLLGGSSQQIVVIEAAKKMGYYTVLCDYLIDNPGQNVADKFYLVSTTDKEKVLQVAKEEVIDGILAYASDPAAPTAAYVAEKLKLFGNPYDSVEILCNKDKFRKFLSENGFNAPQARSYTCWEEVLADKETIRYPSIIKPVDSSGSKGATVLQSENGLEQAVKFAFSFSRCDRIIIEDFIEKKHPYLIGGDVFIVDGKIVLWGLLNCHRDPNVNPLVPVGKSYPLWIEERDEKLVKQTLTDLVNKLGIQNGSMNVELIIDKKNQVWPVDIGPRSGGNMIPDLLGDMFGVDIAEMSIIAAMGADVSTTVNDAQGFYATHNLHSDKSGRYKDIVFDKRIVPYIYRKCLYKKMGDKVEYFDNAAKCLGIVFMKFPNEIIMHDILEHINELITIQLLE